MTLADALPAKARPATAHNDAIERMSSLPTRDRGLSSRCLSTQSGGKTTPRSNRIEACLSPDSMSTSGIKIERLASDLSDFLAREHYFYRARSQKAPPGQILPLPILPHSQRQSPRAPQGSPGAGRLRTGRRGRPSGGGAVLVVGPSTPCRFDAESHSGFHARCERLAPELCSVAQGPRAIADCSFSREALESKTVPLLLSGPDPSSPTLVAHAIRRP